MIGQILRNIFAGKHHRHKGVYLDLPQINELLATKEDANHDHDGSYYTETEVDGFLAGKADESHVHQTTPIEITSADVELSADIIAVNIPEYPSKLSVFSAGGIGLPSGCILRVYCHINSAVVPASGEFATCGAFLRIAPNTGPDFLNIPFVFASERPSDNNLLLYGSYANEFKPPAETYTFEIYVSSRNAVTLPQLYCRPVTNQPWERAAITISVITGLSIAP